VHNPPTFVRKPFWWQIALHATLPSIIIGLVGWIALQIVDVKQDLPLIKASVAQIHIDLNRHNRDTAEASEKNAILHHRRNGLSPCNGCHE
jgi:ABC-type phosphate transport system permease subunit